MIPKPCNHCGSMDLEEVMLTGDTPDIGYIKCVNCGATGPESYDPESAWNARFNEEVMNELMETQIGSLITATLARHESFIKDVEKKLWCNTCKYKRIGGRSFDQHCYMFKELPILAGLCVKHEV